MILLGHNKVAYLLKEWMAGFQQVTGIKEYRADGGFRGITGTKQYQALQKMLVTR